MGAVNIFLMLKGIVEDWVGRILVSNCFLVLSLSASLSLSLSLSLPLTGYISHEALLRTMLRYRFHPRYFSRCGIENSQEIQRDGGATTQVPGILGGCILRILHRSSQL